VVFEFRHLDAVDSRPGFAHLPDFIGAHLTDPKHPMPLQTGVRQIDDRSTATHSYSGITPTNLIMMKVQPSQNLRPTVAFHAMRVCPTNTVTNAFRRHMKAIKSKLSMFQAYEE
jgi:hypothetical protein